MALTFDDIYRQQGINTGPAPAPASSGASGVNFGPVPNNLWDNGQSDLWNLLNGRTQSVGTAYGMGQRWNPDQYSDSASRMAAWEAMGRPNTDYLGRTTTGQDGGGAIRQNFQQVLGMPNTQSPPQNLQRIGEMNGAGIGPGYGAQFGGIPQLPQGYGKLPQMEHTFNLPQVQNTFNPNMQPNRGQFQGYGNYQQPQANMQGMTGMNYGQRGFDFSNPMNYSGYGNWNQQQRQTGKNRGY